LNLSKSGGSISAGPRGAKLTVGPRGVRTTVGIPGTGLYYTQSSSLGGSGRKRSGSRAGTPSAPAVSPPPRPEARLTLGFFQRLTVPAEERELVDGLRELVAGNDDSALNHLRQAAHLADGAFAAGFLSLKKNDFDNAIAYFSSALSMDQDLGKYFNKYGLAFEAKLPITAEFAAIIGPNDRGVLLAMVEAFQREKKFNEALAGLRRLQALAPDDIVVTLSLAELLLDLSPEDRKSCQEIVALGEGVANDSELHAAFLLYKARALRHLGVLQAALDLLTDCLRRTKDRSEDLLRALRYERALTFEALGQPKKARAEFERLYADAPAYEDVAKRLGIGS
jgi:tetratricopeptide (TPR) repeat protein